MRREVMRTIWISDMPHFTPLTLELGPAKVHRRILSMRRAVEAAVAEHDGNIFKFQADSIFAVFQRPSDALPAALDAMGSLSHETMKLSIGIGHGPVLYIPSEKDYYGLEINIASKLGEDLARPGEILMTESAWKKLSPRQRDLFSGPLHLKTNGLAFPYYRRRITAGELKTP
jgi:adenylate cyclase